MGLSLHTDSPDIVSTCSFNHFGPRQAKGLLSICEAGPNKKREQKRICERQNHQDFIDVRDVVKAYSPPQGCQEVYVRSGQADHRGVSDMLTRIVIRCEMLILLVWPVDNPVIVGDTAR
jgi:hypothetical protein